MKYNIAILKGDGIGPEIVGQSLLILDEISKIYNHEFNYFEALIGGSAFDKFGIPLPDESINICKSCDSILLGAVGGPKWDNLPGHLRPEAGLLQIRKEFGLFANIRPVKLFKSLKSSSPLKDDIIGDSLDLCVIRELTGGLYFGKRGRSENSAFDTLEYSQMEVERITRLAFEIARKRNSKLTNVDKMNVLESSRLWREVVLLVAKDYPDVTLNHLLVDNAAMQLILNPKQFDVIVTGNMFGDILSDEASVLTGSIGMLPSASLRNDNFGLYEPIHGSAPDLANKNIANPLATILSIALMLRYSFGLESEASSIESSVEKVLNNGYRTSDIFSDNTTLVSLKEMVNLVKENLL